MVAPVPKKKAARSRQHPSNSTHQTRNTAPVIPEGWAPGPAGEGDPYELPKLVITLPECFTAPFVHQHYEAIRDQLHQRVLKGGHDAVVVIINARMQTLAHNKARPDIVLVSCYYILAISY